MCNRSPGAAGRRVRRAPRLARGGCGEPASDPRAVSPLAFVIGAADPPAPRRRVAVGLEALPATIVLSGDGGLVGLLRPSFFLSANSEVRRLGLGELGDTVVREDGRFVAPIGVLPSGDTVFSLAELEDEDEDERCGSSLFVVAPGSSRRRTLSLGGCPIDDDLPRPAGDARLAGDRVYALVGQVGAQAGGARSPAAIKSVGGDGAAARVLARGTYRPPLGLATPDSGRVARWQRGCAGGSEIVIDDGAAPASSAAIPSCRVKLLNRNARVRGKRITLRLRCAYGCSGQARAGTRRRSRFLRSFSLEPGTHRLRVRLTRRERRRERLRLRLQVDAGRSRAAIRLR